MSSQRCVRDRAGDDAVLLDHEIAGGTVGTGWTSRRPARVEVQIEAHMANPVSETAERAGIKLQWEPATRLILMHFTPELARARLTADDARWALEHVRGWTEDGSDRPYNALVDCRGLGNTDAGWRATLNDYYRSLPPGRVRVAWYNLTPLVRIMAEMSAAVARGIDGKAFRTEPEARAWLERRGAE